MTRQPNGTHQGRLRRAVLIVFGASLLSAPPALARRTSLLRVDLRTGRKTSIDKSGKRDSVDRALDRLLDKSTGKTFTTADLEKIERAIRRYIRTTRPRAAPRLLLFLYPGRISRARLKELREVLVDIDLVVDPCARTVCRDSVAKHLEIIGKSLKKAKIRTSSYVISFKSVTVRTSTRIGGTQYDIYSFKAGEVVKASKRSGGGRKLVRRVVGALAGYDRKMAKAAARQLKLRRVRLAKTPRISRTPSRVSVEIEIRSDRIRYRSHVLGALAGAMKALRSSSLTPSVVNIRVLARVRMRGTKLLSFRCGGHAVREYLDGRITSRALWSNYVVAEKQKGARMTFSDSDARGGARVGSNEPDRTSEILSSHFRLLAPCLQRAAARSRRFKGVTLKFAVSGKGKAIRFSTKERSSARLKRCLKKSLGRIRFQRHGGAPRWVSYPMYIQR